MNKKQFPKDYYKPFKPNRGYYTYHWEVYDVPPNGICNSCYNTFGSGDYHYPQQEPKYASGYGSGYGWATGGRNANSDCLYDLHPS